jgi:hypothetical protein
MTDAQLRRDAIVKQRLKLRKELWPDIDDAHLWDRKLRKGFTTIPRTMSLISAILNSVCKGKPVSKVYLEIWCRLQDEGFVTVKDERAFAFACGFAGERGNQTLADRLSRLERHGFIRTAEGEYGRRTHILVLDPYRAIAALAGQKGVSVPKSLLNALASRKSEIKAD